MNITFIGNCQLLTLCYYFQQLLNLNENNICWILYGPEWKKHIGEWANKCKNKIVHHNVAIRQIKHSDIIIYQTINTCKSHFSNTKSLNELKKPGCILIQLPSIYLDYSNFHTSINKLIEYENKNNVTIPVSNIFNKFKDDKLMLTCYHPTTFLFMEIIKIICSIIDIDFFTQEQYNHFLSNNNYMGLP